MRKIVLVVVCLLLFVSLILLIERSKVETSPSEDARSISKQVKTDSVSSSTNASRNVAAAEQSSGKSVLKNEVVVFTKAELSEPVQLLFGLDDKEHNYPELLAAIHQLGYELSDVDVSALMEMLMFPNDRFPEKMRDIEINAVKNDVLDRLLRQKQLPEGLGLQMVEMAENPENDPVWRDYCVQFMEPFYERRSKVQSLKVERNSPPAEGRPKAGVGSSESASSAQSVDELTAIHDAMFFALDERSETIAGTALIGLELLSRSHDEFDRKQIVEKAVEIASDEMASSSSRLTALRLSAMTEGSESAAGVARSLAQTGETVLLRSAAIVTLGEVGSADDRELLESFTFAENKQIADAARLALGKMNSKN